MVSLEVLAILLSGISISASLFYYANVLQNQNKTRQTQMLMELYSAYRDPEFGKIWGEVMDYEYTDFDDFWEKYGGPNNRDSFSKWQSVARFLNGVGVLLKQNMVDIDLVEELLANIVFYSWYKMSPIVLGFRELTKHQNEGKGKSTKYEQLSGFEYLYNELNKRDPRK